MRDTIDGGIDKTESITRSQLLAVAAGAAMALVTVWLLVSNGMAIGQFDSVNGETLIFEERTGVRLVRVALVSGGGMLDLQYQILDPDKALAVHDDENPPTLVDDRTGAILATPFHDHSFRELKTAVTYHELIMNGDGLLRRGGRVTLIIGEEKLERVPVE